MPMWIWPCPPPAPTEIRSPPMELIPTSHGSRDMRLFFDVETTDMIDWKAPMLSPRQPRVVQLAAILDDADGRMVSTIDAIVDPMTSNWSEPVLDALIHSDVSRIHGISYDIARTQGRHILDIVNEFATLV